MLPPITSLISEITVDLRAPRQGAGNVKLRARSHAKSHPGRERVEAPLVLTSVRLSRAWMVGHILRQPRQEVEPPVNFSPVGSMVS